MSEKASASKESSADTSARIVEARMKLRERFLEKERARTTPKPLGSGPPNRHGMPKLPVGQHAVKNWPVLDLGIHPKVPLSEWRLEVAGTVDQPLSLTWEDFQRLPQVEDVSDFHCVTTWSRMDVRWGGVAFATVVALAQPRAEAAFVYTTSYDGYTTNLALEEALKDDVLLVHTVDGAPLPVEHGGPVRLITPQLYAWKGGKWIRRIELLAKDKRGYWEERGYSNTARPWEDDRYS